MNERLISPLEAFAGLLEPSRALKRQWTLPADLPYFDGHFPGEPVLPAVAIVDASLAVLGSILDAPELRLLEISSAKFTHVMGPGSEMVIEAKDQGQDQWSVDWSARHPQPDEKPYVSLCMKVGR